MKISLYLRKFCFLSSKGFVFVDFTKIIRCFDGSKSWSHNFNALWMRDFSTIPVSKYPKYIFILLVYGKISLCSSFVQTLNNKRLDLLFKKSISRKRFIDFWFGFFNKGIQMFAGDYSSELHLIE